MHESPIMWGVFFAIVAILLALDLGVFHRTDRPIAAKESLIMSAGYILIALLFSLFIAYERGTSAATDYVTGFLVEKSLSIDNIFVIAFIFGFFSIPDRYQHRVLFWGILGVIILRGIMIALGAELVARFEWVLYVFAAFLILTGFKMLFVMGDDDAYVDLEKNPVIRWLQTHMRITKTLHGNHFFVRLPNPQTTRKEWWATPLFLALISVECADIIFAVDSVPAVFTITRDPYIVYTSNIFAILGLRSLYFALSAVIHRFYYLKYALALVLVFIGGKVFVTPLLGLEKFPAFLSLGVTITLLTGGVLYSMYKTKHTPQNTQ